jgi:hypothetical protein
MVPEAKLFFRDFISVSIDHLAFRYFSHSLSTCIMYWFFLKMYYIVKKLVKRAIQLSVIQNHEYATGFACVSSRLLTSYFFSFENLYPILILTQPFPSPRLAFYTPALNLNFESSNVMPTVLGFVYNGKVLIGCEFCPILCSSSAEFLIRR